MVHAAESLATATLRNDLILLSRVIRGAKASLTAISAQQVIATATESAQQAEATLALLQASYNLQRLALEENFYKYYMNLGANVFFFVVFALLLFFNVGMLYKSRHHWYNISFICGFILEFLGFLGRILSTTDYTNMNYYLLQYAPLTISPAFFMAGIYFIFAQNVIMYGKQYTILPPIWYSYFFIASDAICLIVQGVGGGMASEASKTSSDPAPGTWTMFAGVLAQTVAMSVFVIFWFNFLWRLYFHHTNPNSTNKLAKKGLLNYFRLMLHLPSTRAYKAEELEPFYDPEYHHIRQRKLVPYFPLAITIAVAAIYIRCIYRVVELKEGFDGYLITHEVFIMVLDAALIFIAGAVFVPFHPVFVFGPKNIFNVARVRGKHDAVQEDKRGDESLDTLIDEVPPLNVDLTYDRIPAAKERA